MFTFCLYTPIGTSLNFPAHALLALLLSPHQNISTTAAHSFNDLIDVSIVTANVRFKPKRLLLTSAVLHLMATSFTPAGFVDTNFQYLPQEKVWKSIL